MHFVAPPRLPARHWSVALLALLAYHSPAADTYGVQAQQLQIPTATIGNAIYSNLLVGVTAADIVVPPNGSVPFWSVDTYNPANNELFVPTVIIGSATDYNVTVKAGPLVVIGGVSGADTYTGGTLSIPEVQVGPVIYTNVMATIASIQNLAGGMPTSAIDIYSPSTHQLAVAAVQAGSKAYTNVLATPGTILSVGGQLPVESMFYSFDAGSGSGPSYPNGALIKGADGNFYGTTNEGGANHLGTVYRLTPAGVASVVYSFAGGHGDGSHPGAGLVQGPDGTLYGTTGFGGATNSGTVFKVTLQGQESVLYSFASATDASIPEGSLLLDASDNLYGVSYGGGIHGCGTVYKVTPQGTETVLHSFAGSPDGAEPQTALTLGTDGNYYGTTEGGGAADLGAAFKMTPAGSVSILHSFGATAGDGIGPFAGLTEGPDGNFYGATNEGGSFSGIYDGTVFRMTPGGTVTILHSFSGQRTPTGQIDGTNPQGNLYIDGSGNLYGTTYDGGAYNSGILFKLTPAGKEIILYTNGRAGVIAGNTDANFIQCGMVLGADGNLYGMGTSGGANESGVVFKLTGALSAY